MNKIITPRKKHRRVESKLYLQIFLIVAFFIIATNTQSGWLFFMISMMIATLFLNSIMPYLMIRGLAVEVTAPDFSNADEEAEIKVAFKNHGRVPVILTNIQLNVFERSIESYLSYLDRRETLTTVYDLVPKYRGIYTELTYSLRTAAPFGLFSIFGTRHHLKVPINSVVFPSFYKLRTLPTATSRGSEPIEGKRRQRKNIGQEYFGSREYQSDDSYKAVNWKATAKAGKLMVKEFEDISREPINIVLDTNLGSIENVKTARDPLEEMIKVMVSLARVCEKEQYPFNVFSAGQSREILVRPQLREVLYWGAAFEFRKNSMPYESVRLLSADRIQNDRSIIITNTLKSTDLGAFTEFRKSKNTNIAIVIDAATFIEEPDKGSEVDDPQEPSAALSLKPPELLNNRIFMDAREIEELRKILVSCRVEPYIFQKGDDLNECFNERSRYIAN